MEEPVHWHRCGQGTAIDPYFGLPLWFKDSVKNHTLWAYNRKHLAFIFQLVEAELREVKTPNNRNLSNRLPKWMLERKNRTRVMKALRRLQSVA